MCLWAMVLLAAGIPIKTLLPGIWHPWFILVLSSLTLFAIPFLCLRRLRSFFDMCQWPPGLDNYHNEPFPLSAGYDETMAWA